MGAGLRRLRFGGISTLKRWWRPVAIVAVTLSGALALAVPAFSGSARSALGTAGAPVDRATGGPSVSAEGARTVAGDAPARPQTADRARAATQGLAPAQGTAARVQAAQGLATRPQPMAVPARGEVTGTGAGRAAAMTSAAPPSSTPAPTVTTVRYGPIPVLPALLGTPGHTTAGVPLLANLPLLPMPCSNCFVTGTTIGMVYENGQPANLDSGVMLHHMVLFQPQVDDTTCPRTTPVGLLGQRVFASGNERTSGVLPNGYGVHFGGGPLTVYFDIMNHSDQPKLVYLTATVNWLPDSTPGIKAVTPVWLDENNCSMSTYAIPAGPTDKVWRWTSTMTGRFVAAGGHVHDGGVKTSLMNETTGEHICSSVAGYGTRPAYMGTVESMSVCSWDRLGTVRRGEVLALNTSYNSSEAQNDVMGIMIAYLYPTDDLTGGTPAPESMTNPPAITVPPPTAHHHG